MYPPEWVYFEITTSSLFIILLIIQPLTMKYLLALTNDKIFRVLIKLNCAMKNEFEPAALLARSFLGQVALMSETMVVKSLSGHRSEVGHGAELLYSLSA